MNTKDLVLYRTQEGDININVLVENDTVWLTQSQMWILFNRNRTVINKHFHNIFEESELDEKVVCANFAHTTQHGAIAGKTQKAEVKLYNLDVIISVGYQVKSQQGTQFRIWANKVLKDYIIKGYAVNEKMQLQQYNDLKQTIKVLSNVIKNKELSNDEAFGLMRVITDYTYALDTLDKYDYQQLAVEKTTDNSKFRATYNGKDLYPSIEEKAAMLLYLVALTLMIAESRTEEKDVMVKVVVNLINGNN